MAAVALGKFTGECLTKTGEAYTYLESTVKGKIQELSKENDSLKSVLNWFTPERQEFIGKVIFALGVLYSFKQSKLMFLASSATGFFASLGRTPECLSFNTLSEGELLSMKAQEGLQAQKMMAFLAFLNAYLGSTLLDNIFFTGLSGLIAGNCTCHFAKEKINEKIDTMLDTTAGKYALAIKDDLMDRISKVFNETPAPNKED